MDISSSTPVIKQLYNERNYIIWNDANEIITLSPGKQGKDIHHIYNSTLFAIKSSRIFSPRQMREFMNKPTSGDKRRLVTVSRSILVPAAKYTKITCEAVIGQHYRESTVIHVGEQPLPKEELWSRGQ